MSSIYSLTFMLILYFFCSNNKWHYFQDPRREGNTGLYFIRSTPQTIQLLQDSYLYTKQDGFRTDDQKYFWRFLRLNSTQKLLFLMGKCRDLDTKSKEKEEVVAFCALDSCVFTAGAAMREYHGNDRYL